MKSSGEVREQILEAFRDVPMPSADRLLVSPGRSSDEDAIAVREFLAGKRWDALPREILEDWWAYFSHLSGEAYQCYLPALLITALNCWDEGEREIYSAVLALTPQLIAVYYDGIDEDFDLRISLFTSEQFAAVGAFLGLFINSQPVPLTFHAARAYRLGWDRIETEEREAFGSFHSRMRDWQYPYPPPAESASLIDEIIEAFAATPYPGDDALCNSEAGDDEPFESALDFRGTDWRRLHPALLAANYTSLSFLSPAGFRYFLPAYLLADLYGAHAGSNAEPVFPLTMYLSGKKEPSELEQVTAMVESGLFPGEEGAKLLDLLRQNEATTAPPDMQQHALESMAPFSRAEREAIVRYLEYRAAHDKYRADKIRAALSFYWLPSLRR